MLPIYLLHMAQNLQNTRADEEYTVLHDKCLGVKAKLVKQLNDTYMKEEPNYYPKCNKLAVNIMKAVEVKDANPILVEANDLDLLTILCNVKDLHTDTTSAVMEGIWKILQTYKLREGVNRSGISSPIVNTLTSWQLFQYVYARYYGIYTRYHQNMMLSRLEIAIFLNVAKEINSIPEFHIINVK